MKVYRIVEKQYSDHASICNGLGAKKVGGRWNLPGTPAIYVSSELEAAVCEVAIYSISANYHSLGKSSNFTAEDISCMIDINITIVEIEIPENLALLDFTSDSVLGSWPLQGKKYLVRDSILSPYGLLANRWSQRIGTAALGSGAIGLKVKSARMSQTDNIVLNSANSQIPTTVKIKDVFDAKLSAVDIAGNVWNGKNSLDLLGVRFECQSRMINKVLKIEHHPI